MDIFVEDTTCHNMWLFLLRRLLRSGTRLTSVNQVGGRSNVIQACRTNPPDATRRRIYIIDGDFDFLLGKSAPRLLGLYRLNAYCIENILLNEAAVTDIALKNATGKSEAAVFADLNYVAWMLDVEAKLKPLFILYAISIVAGTGDQTTARSVTKFFVNTKDGPALCPIKIRRVMFELGRSTRDAVGLHRFSLIRRAVQIRADKLKLRKVVSGKSYLMPLLMHRLQRTAKFRGTSEQLLQLLASDFLPNWDRGLSNRLAAL